MHLLSTLSGVAGVALHVGGWSARVLRRCCHKMHVTELLCPLGGPDGLHCLVLGTLCNNRDFLPTSMRLVKLPSLYDTGTRPAPIGITVAFLVSDTVIQANNLLV